MESLIRTLPNLLRTIDSPEVVEAAVLAGWRQAAGEGLRDHAVPVHYRERILTVVVADTVWQKQLSTICAQMVFRINNLVGQSLLDRIELEIDPSVVKHRRIDQRQQQSIEENDVPPELWTAANAISDKHLRESFLRAAVSATKRNENLTTT